MPDAPTNAKPPLNVCLIGQKFMGRTHSNAYLKVGKFFGDVPLEPVMHTICGRDLAELEAFARCWGWQNACDDWRRAVVDPAIGLVDVGTPNHVHREQAIAALEAGKHVACEKPLAGTLADAREMMEAARRAKKSKTFVWYNYRRVPAVALAHQLVKEGRLGRIYHVRAFYLQDWGGPDTPLLWRFQRKFAGSGAHGDLNAHIVDMARFVTGDEVVEVNGAVAPTFIRERTIPESGSKGGIAEGSRGGSRKGRSDVDDALLFLATFKSGAVASFEATRLATGRQNRNGLEVNGERGSVFFNFEEMNYLDFFDADLPQREQGWRRIMCTDAEHPYAAHWWPAAHIIGYEHTFVNQAADMLTMIAGGRPVVPMPDFADAYRTQQVLEAALVSARERSAVKVSELQ